MIAQRRHVTISWRGRRESFELITIDDEGHELEIGAAASWHRMKDEAAKAGVKLLVNTAFRDYAYQKLLRDRWEQRQIYERKVKEWEDGGKAGDPPEKPKDEKVLTASPANRPGSSMHEAGMAIDVRDCNDATDPNYIWLKANAKRFGWALRVPSEKWHIEYIFGPAAVA